MVVKTSSPAVEVAQLDIAYLGLFLGLRVNEIVRQRMGRAGFKGVRDSHGYLIQHLIGGDRTASELARRMELSQQAVSKTISELTALGVVETAPAQDRRSKHVRLSRKGWKCVQFQRRVRKQIDKQLSDAAGITEYHEAKATLIRCLELLGGMHAIKSRTVRRPD